ncbi:MAG: GNAT family N-acetyltransferase [Planctomycetales bacterium]|nr:GNAT family N-acetyltransferase [Planctomycetales bacterium]
MIRFRPFLNCDPPALLRVWREQPATRGLMQPMSNLLLEIFVLSKPYFDRQGLIVAHEDGEVIGFAHAGFGPNEARDDISTELGIICVLAARQHAERHEILLALLDRCEGYLRDRGAKRIRVGGSFPYSPFYLGLCGGSDLPGVLSTDTETDQLLRNQGFRESNRCLVFERSLHRFRPPVDRRVLQHRRNYRLVPQVNPQNAAWWEACVYGPTDRIRFKLEPKGGGESLGQITFWDMGPLSTRPNAGGMGMIDFWIDESMQRQGLGLFLASESLKHLENSGIYRVETQTMVDKPGAIELLRKLDFVETHSGIFYTKGDEEED